MRAAIGKDLQVVLDEARDLARQRGSARVLTSHTLLALAIGDGAVNRMLAERRIDPAKLAQAMRVADDEPDHLGDLVCEKACALAGSLGAPEASAVHYLLAITHERRSAAFMMLEKSGANPAAMRAQTYSMLTNGPPLVRRAKPASASSPSTPSASPSSSAHGRSPSARRRPPVVAAPRNEPLVQPNRAAPPPPSPRAPSVARKVVKTPVRVPPPQPIARPTEPLAPDARPRTTLSAPPRNDSAAPRNDASPPSSPGSPAPTTRSAPVRIEPPTPFVPRDDRPAARARIVRAEDPGERFELDPSSFPFLSAVGRNLTALAARGLVEPIVGRERLVEQVLDVLAKRRANCPCLVGPPGVGKTTLVDGVALALVRSAAERPSEPARALVSVSIVDMVVGTGVRGALSERIRAVTDEVGRANGRIVLFLDQTHALLAADQSEDAATDLKAAMARGELPCIGATTPAEYRKHVESDSSLERRFTRIDVEEPTPEEALSILRGAVRAYAEHHHVAYDEGALDAAVTFGVRYIPSRCLPDKAISLLDLAGARARRRGERRVDRSAVAHVVADVAAVPVERLLHTDADRLLALEEHLAKTIVGHRPVLARISDVLRRNAVGFRGKRPIGTFLFLGPTGVGKTETAKAVAEMLFPGGAAISRFDMAEMSEPHAVARLVGAPPGYVGHDEGGQLTEAVRRRPYQLVLLDEIEKAHRDVVLALLGVLDEGRMTDGRGRTVDFTNTVVVLTSNLGSSVMPTSGGLGFGTPSTKTINEQGPAARIIEAARASLAPELWNRIDEPLVFLALTRPEVAEVARRMIAGTASALRRDQGIEVRYDETAIAALLDAGGYDPRLGARPMRRTVQRVVEAPIAELVLRGAVRRGGAVVVRGDGDRVVVSPG